MNRRAAATMLGIALFLSARPGMAQEPAPSPFAPLPRIQDTINAVVPGGEVVPPGSSRPAKGTSNPAPSARPSAFAVPNARTIRPRSIPAVPPPIDEATAAPKTVEPAGLPDLPPDALPSAPADPSLRMVSREVATPADPSMAKIGPTRRGTPTGEIAATVGPEQITHGELRLAILERLDGTPRDKIPPDAYEAMCRSILERLIQRTLVIQAAKAKLKNDKNWDNFMKQVENVWRDHEIPELIQKYGVKDRYELSRAMERRGLSLDRVRESFKLQTAANEFVRNELQGKMKVDLPEQRAYYEAHMKEFDRPAQVSWREVLVEVGKNKGRAGARRKAEAILARLRKGDDFTAVVKAESDGPNANKGGLWETSPGSYAVPAVNEALDSLPVGQVSPILEGPDAYHIIRVEDRRQAGPAPFMEVQLKIREIIKEEKYNKGAESYFQKLRGKTLITSPMFAGSPMAPPSVNSQAFAVSQPPTRP